MIKIVKRSKNTTDVVTRATAERRATKLIGRRTRHSNAGQHQAHEASAPNIARHRVPVPPAPVLSLAAACTRLAQVLTISAEDATSVAEALLAYAAEDQIGGGHNDPSQATFPPGTVWGVEGQILYALVRLLRPRHVLEAGCYIGASSTHLLAALERNGEGRLTSVDIDAGSGGMIPANLRGRLTFVVGRGQDLLRSLQGADVDLVFDDASHFADDTAEILQAARSVKPIMILSHDAEHPRWRDEVHDAHRRVFGRCSSILVEPSDCGLAYAVERLPERVRLRDGAPLVLTRAETRTEYVIGSYMGGRQRGGAAYGQDGSWILREHVRMLSEVKHEIDLVTIVHNEIGIAAEAYFDELPNRLGQARVRVIRRPNVGFSYGAFCEASRQKSGAEHLILVEDDYCCPIDGFDAWMLDRGVNGMLAPAVWPWQLKGGPALPHAALFGGPVRADAFAKAIADGWNGHPAVLEETGYEAACWSQVRLSQAVVLAGYDLKDWLDSEYAFAYLNCDEEIDWFTNTNARQAMLVPIQALDHRKQISIYQRVLTGYDRGNPLERMQATISRDGRLIP